MTTCSCAYPDAFEPDKVVGQPFCAKLSADAKKKTSEYYEVNCVNDLDPDGGTQAEVGWNT